MARTKQELTDLSAARIHDQNRAALNWGRFISALNQAATPQREQILAAIIQGDTVGVGTFVITQVEVKHKTDADREAVTILADDNVTLDELDRIL